MMPISSSTQCVAHGGACALPADCDDASVLLPGTCGDNDQRCCITKDDMCTARNGTCVSSEVCAGEEDKHVSRMGCSDSICCVPNRAFPRRFGDCDGEMDGSRGGAGRPWDRPGHGRPGNYPGGRHRDGRPDGDRRRIRPHGGRRNQGFNDDRSDWQPEDDSFDIEV